MPTFSTADSSAADRTRPTADGTVKVTLETPLPTSAPTQASQSPPLSVCPLNQQSPDRRREAGGLGKKTHTHTNVAFFPSRCQIEAPAPSKTADSTGVRRFERSDNESNHGASPPPTTAAATVTAVFSPSVAASRSAARVDGSQLHMRRDPARSPIDAQRIASLQFPGFGARWARFDTSISPRTNKTRHRHEYPCEP